MSETGKAVFLSYASQDAVAVQRIADALRAAGLEVWFDQDELRGGDEWDRKIKKQIRTCALFVPVISANTQSRPEGYFRLEWHLAEQRSLLIAKGRPFLVPLCIDDTRETVALAPDAFLAVQWMRVGSDARLAQLVAQVQRLLAGGVAPASSRQARSGAASGSDGTGSRSATTIPDYELIRKIGEGGYGEVWLARGLTGAYRAVKIVWRNRFADAEPFEREFRGLKEFTAMSSEANQLALLHVGRDERAGFFYYVMELADDAERGRTIDPARYVPLTAKELKVRRKRLPAAECVTFGVELTRSLAGLHARGLLHRDIKPSNVILVNGVPKLADIGLVASSGDARTFVGTEGFVPPEGPGTPAADVFALGKVLYELATGRDRAEYPNLPENLGDARERSALFALNDVILRACDTAPAQRYRDGAALLADLSALQAGRPVRRLARWQIAAAAVATIGLVAGTAWKYYPRPAAPLSATAAQAAAAKPAIAEKSIAVLPFENLSEDKDSAYFAGGLHGDLLASLTRISQLRVVPRTTVEQYRATKKTMAEIATELDVAYVLEGSVQRDRNRVVLAGRLFRASGGQLVWADKFQRSLDDIFQLQSELSQLLAAKLETVIAPKELAAIAQSPTKSTEAYQLLLKSIHLWKRDFINAATGLEVQQLLEQAVKLDPDFTRAWTELAMQAVGRYFLGHDRSPEQLERARGAIDQCLRLAPDAASTQAVLGWYHYEIRGDYARGLEYFQRAVELEPNVADHHIGIAMVLRRQGKWIEAGARLKQAAQLEPRNIDPLRYLAMNMTYLRRYADAVELSRRVNEIEQRPASQRDDSQAARSAFLLSGSTAEMDAFLAAVPAEERESPAGLARRHTWALTKGDFAEALRIDAILSTPDRRARENTAFTVANALALAATGDLVGARARLGDRPRQNRERLEKDPPNVGTANGWARLAQMEALLGRREAVLECAAKAAETYPEAGDALWGPPISLTVASARAWLGDRDYAIAELKRLLGTTVGMDGNVHALRRGAAFFPLRGEARFEALLIDPRNNAPLDGTPARALAPAKLTSTAAPASPVSAEKPAAVEKSLVVLPLENLSPDPENAFFTDGMHSEIIATLSRIPDLRVVSRTSALSLKGAALSLGEAAKKMGAANAMSGSVRRSGQAIRIQLELRRASDETLLWSQTYAQELTDPLVLQTDIAENVARALQARESPGAFGGARFSTKSPQAFDLFLKARGLFEIGDLRGDGMVQAVKLLEEALALDPGFVSAASLLTNIIADLARGSLEPAQRVAYAAEAKRYAEMASRLAPSGAGDAMLAFYYAVIEGEGAKALALADNAIRALPNDAVHHNIRGLALSQLGRVAEALQAYRRARELDPLTPVFRSNELQALVALRRWEEFETAMVTDQGRSAAAGSLMLRARYELRGELPASVEGMSSLGRATWLWLARRFVEADASMAEVRKRPPVADANRFGLLCGHHDVLVRLGRAEDAAQAAREAYTYAEKLQAVPEVGLSRKGLYLAQALVRVGRHEEAIAEGRRYVETASASTQTGTRWRREGEFAEILASAGRTRECVDLLAKLIRLPATRITVPVLRLDPAWDNVRADPRFQAILADPKNSAPL